jgi:hypothetical protein
MAVRFSDFIAARSAGTIDGSDVVAIKAGATVRVDGDDVATVAGVAAAYAPLDAGRSGTGFPEGVVTAPVGTVYRDTAATNGAVLWVKATGSGNTGWQVAYGDTGWRDITSTLTAEWNATDSFLYIRRVSNTVQVTMNAATNPASTRPTSATVFGIPTGFGGSFPVASNDFTLYAETPGSVVPQLIVARVTSGGNFTVLVGNRFPSTGTFARGNVTYSVRNLAWPATLPGSAA